MTTFKKLWDRAVHNQETDSHEGSRLIEGWVLRQPGVHHPYEAYQTIADDESYSDHWSGPLFIYGSDKNRRWFIGPSHGTPVAGPFETFDAARVAWVMLGAAGGI